MKQNISEDDMVATLNIDAAADLNQLNMDTVVKLQTLGPFGQGNPEPIFVTKGVRLLSPPRRVGSKADHLQLAITDDTAAVRCIGFGMGHLEKKLLEREFFDVAYQPQIDSYNGSNSVQLVLAGIQFE